ncbi:MAG: site-specific DNA-methyltransferase [Aestuariivirga sp.]
MDVKSENWPAFQVERRKAADLKPYKNNARTHSKEQVAQIAASIREWGFTNPILVDEADGVIAGHGRLEAATSLGVVEVPVIVARGWTQAQKRAYVLADNQLALNAGWDENLLRIELAEIGLAGLEVPIMGFSDEFLSDLFKTKDGKTEPDDTPEPEAVAASQPGDVWLLGKHRVMCGNSLSLDDVNALTGGTTPDIANCDPPYGIKAVKGSAVGGSKPFGKTGGGGMTRFGRVHGRAKNAIIESNVYAEIIGDDSTETAIKSYAVLSVLGVPAIILWGGNYFAESLPPSRCWLVWDKETNGNFADAELAWTNQDAVVRLFRHQWSGLIKASERGERRVHPTQKPVALAEWVLETIAPKAKTAIDLFLGSGSMLIACERKEIQFFGMEMSPHYVDVAVKRWEAFAGKTATLQGDGRTFKEIHDERTAT